MKRDLGFTAADKSSAAAFARKVDMVNARAVASCDQEHLGYLLDPFSCSYDPTRDAGALCAGVAANGVTGTSTDSATCMTAKEAVALNKIWYGATVDGSYDPDQSADARSGKLLKPGQIWWTFTRGTGIGGTITSASTDNVAVALQQVSYAADASATTDIPDHECVDEDQKPVAGTRLRRSRRCRDQGAGHSDLRQLHDRQSRPSPGCATSVAR